MQEQFETLIEEMALNSGKTNAQIKEMVDGKIKKFSGLLTEQGAIFMVQKELGLKKEETTQLDISELQDGQKNVSVKGKIKIVFPVKEFEKGEKTGKLSSFILEDKSGEIRVTLWNDQVEKYDLISGSEIEIENGIVSSYNEKKQLSLGFNGTINIIKKSIENFEKINNLKGGMNGVNLYGRILRKFPVKEFNSNEKKGKLCNFQFGDETTLLRATAWNEKADEIIKLNDGSVVEIKNAYTKNGMYGIELHLGYNAIIKNSDKEMPSTIEIMKENIDKKTINNISENENVIITGKIINILDGKLFFLICEKCGKKIEQTETGNICEKCGEVKGKVNPVININIEDDTAGIKLVLFGKDALSAIKMNQEDFENKLNEKSTEKIINELNEKLNGTKIEIFGYSKINTYSNENEFRVKEVVKVN